MVAAPQKNNRDCVGWRDSGLPIDKDIPILGASSASASMQSLFRRAVDSMFEAYAAESEKTAGGYLVERVMNANDRDGPGCI